jgi:hypothetical protein
MKFHFHYNCLGFYFIKYIHSLKYSFLWIYYFISYEQNLLHEVICVWNNLKSNVPIMTLQTIPLQRFLWCHQSGFILEVGLIEASTSLMYRSTNVSTSNTGELIVSWGNKCCMWLLIRRGFHYKRVEVMIWNIQWTPYYHYHYYHYFRCEYEVWLLNEQTKL